MLLQQVANGLMLGGTYALVAIGYSLVFGVLRLIKMCLREKDKFGVLGHFALWWAAIAHDDCNFEVASRNVFVAIDK